MEDFQIGDYVSLAFDETRMVVSNITPEGDLVCMWRMKRIHTITPKERIPKPQLSYAQLMKTNFRQLAEFVTPGQNSVHKRLRSGVFRKDMLKKIL